MSYDFANINFDKLTGQFDTAYDIPITLVAWVHKTAAQWLDASDNHPLMLANLTSTPDNSVRIRCIAHDVVSCTQRSTTDGTANHAFTASAYDDKWVPVIAVFTADDDRDIYIEDFTHVQNSSNDKPLTATMDKIAAGGSTSSDFAGFEGLVAEVAIFNIALVESEINALVDGSDAGGFTGPPPNTVKPGNCIGYWPMLDDQSTHSNEGSDTGGLLTVISGAPHSTDHPTITAAGGTVNTRTLKSLLRATDGSPIG